MKFVALNVMRQEQGLIGEISAILWDTSTQTIWDQYSVIIKNNSVESSADDYGIPSELRKLKGQSIDGLVFMMLSNLMDQADLIITFGNMYSDRMLLEKSCTELKREYLETTEQCLGIKPWCYLKEDLNLQLIKQNPELGLARLARELKIPLPLSLRASSRALSIALISQKYIEQIEQSIVKHRYIVKALVSFEEKDKAKNAGFRWEKIVDNGKKYEKSWVKVVREDYLDLFEKQWGFPTNMIERYV